MSHKAPEAISRGWRKSSFSEGANGCVELAVAEVAPNGAPNEADADRLYLVRDSKNPDGPVLAFTPEEWAIFVGGVKTGELDLEDQLR